MKYTLLFALLFGLLFQAYPQRIKGDMPDERELYAQTKQMNQFFRRFNNEEDMKGIRYGENPPRRNDELRKGYLEQLFNNDPQGVPERKRDALIQQVTTVGNPQYIEFHNDGWYAEVSALFNYKGSEKPVTLYMKLEPSGLGSEWVLINVFFEPYARRFSIDTAKRNQTFMHPMSHELDFMNLRKVFDHPSDVFYYTSKDYRPDFLTIFLEEAQAGMFDFKTVTNVRFHFLQVPGWYFTVDFYNRRGYNSGWLISEATQVDKEGKEQIRELITNN